MKTHYVPRKMNTDDNLLNKKDVEREFREIGNVIDRIGENTPSEYASVAPNIPQLGATVFIYKGGWVPDEVLDDFIGDSALLMYVTPPMPRHGAIDRSLYVGKWFLLSNFTF